MEIQNIKSKRKGIISKYVIQLNFINYEGNIYNIFIME